MTAVCKGMGAGGGTPGQEKNFKLEANVGERTNIRFLCVDSTWEPEDKA